MSASDELTSTSDGTVKEEQENTKNTLICGIVEGFYGKPWTLQQRKHLFEKLRLLGLNTYLYAPKDDVKHRGEWRQLYNPEEIEILQELISCCSENGIDFVYALSPGIDIQYSQRKDIDFVKEKLSQVKSLGCNSFALLFDDIEPEMQEVDKKQFVSFASAQVAVANEIYKFLECPRQFYFCPTEYCETRAQPTLSESEYLNTVGEKLLGQIHVLWTGSQVIAKTMPIEHVLSVSKVLRRKPVIWDNLHANDYDPRRLFLGPFAGREIELKEHISGLLLNPNCKYEANFIPFHTLGDWFHAIADAPNVNDSSAILELGGISPVAQLVVEKAKPNRLYHPLSSLREAVELWTAEFDRCVQHFFSGSDSMEKMAEVEMASPQNLSEIIQTAVNEMESTPNNINSLRADNVERMDVTVPQTTPKLDASEDTATDSVPDEPMESSDKTGTVISSELLSLLVDIFFLPFDGGRRANDMLDQFCWLYENTGLVAGLEETNPIKEEWLRRLSVLKAYITNVKQVFRIMSECPNKLLVAELIPYVWEAHGVCTVLEAVAEWLKLDALRIKPDEQPRFWAEESADEPWLGNGGFLNNVYKVLAGGGALYNFCLFKCMLPLSIVDFTISPLTTETALKLSALACIETERTTEQNDLNRSLFVDKYVRLYIENDSHHVFIAEDDTNSENKAVICSAIAVADASPLLDKLPKYVEELKEKYSRITVSGVNVSAVVSEMDDWFPKIPRFVLDSYPSWMDVRFSADAYDAVPTRRLILAMAISLSMNGSKGVFVSIPASEADKILYFARIGFVEVTRSEDFNFVILGRNISSGNNEEARRDCSEDVNS